MQDLGVVDAPLDDAETARSWSASGARWLTDPAVAVPGRLVRRVIGLVEALDQRGSGLAELVPARGLGLLAERAACMGLPASARTSAGGASRLVSAADGWFVLSLTRNADRDLVPAWLERDIDVHDVLDPWQAIEDLARDRTVAELVERGGLLGLPCGGVGEVTDDRPVVLHQIGGSTGRPIAGATVVNLAALWAGPLCADVLGRLGARVVTVESTRRPDGGRLARPFFAALHGRSESVALDLTTEPGRDDLRRLLLGADIVIEGSRPRALEQMGIEAADVAARGPRVWLSITGFGRDAPHRERVGFGDDAAAAGGLVGWVNDEPRFVADAVADPLTGLTAAVAATELLETGGRWLADVSLSRVARSVAGGWSAHGSGPVELPRPRRDPGAPMPLGRDTDSVFESLRIDRLSP